MKKHCAKLCAILVLGFMSSAPGSGPAHATANLCEREISAASSKHSVPLAVLYAVALNESGRKGRLNPYAMNIEGASLYPANLQEAMTGFKKAYSNGKQLIDVGCMQINHYWHYKKFLSVQHMFDPHANVNYAAKFLRQLYEREKSWTMAVAIYHAGTRNRAAQKRYICGVVRKLVRSGFGAWTNQARAFCK